MEQSEPNPEHASPSSAAPAEVANPVTPVTSTTEAVGTPGTPVERLKRIEDAVGVEEDPLGRGLASVSWASPPKSTSKALSPYHDPDAVRGFSPVKSATPPCRVQRLQEGERATGGEEGRGGGLGGSWDTVGRRLGSPQYDGIESLRHRSERAKLATKVVVDGELAPAPGEIMRVYSDSDDDDGGGGDDDGTGLPGVTHFSPVAFGT